MEWGAKRSIAGFVALCVLMIALNAYISDQRYPGDLDLTDAIYQGIGASVISIPLWAVVGVLIGRVISRRGRPTDLATRASMGVLVGIVAKAFFPDLP